MRPAINLWPLIVLGAGLWALRSETKAAEPRTEPPIQLAVVSEEALPSEDLPAASPGSLNSPVPPPRASSPASASEPAANNAPVSAVSPSSSETPSLTGDRLETASPNAAPSAPPPALDLSAAPAAPDLGSASLAPEVRRAAAPGLAASIRITEQARNELRQGDADDALRDLGRAVSIDGGNPFAYYYLGRVYLARKNYSQALTFFERAELGFTARPDWRGETLSYEGACEEELGSEPDAAKAYQRAVADAPGNFRAQAGYGRMGASVAPPSALDAPPPAPASDIALPPPLTSPPAPPPVPSDDSRD
jgi:hypothetical protein